MHDPTEIWLIVCKDIDTNSYHKFINVTSDPEVRKAFLEFYRTTTLVIGHNLLGFDIPVMDTLLGVSPISPGTKEIDTLILSKLIDYPRPGHSVKDYGEEFNFPKGEFTDWSSGYSKEMEDYCVRDVDITHRIYLKYLKYITNSRRIQSIITEHEFQTVCNQLERSGFAFNVRSAEHLLHKVNDELISLDRDILAAFPQRPKLIREVSPKATKFGTISLSSIPKKLRDQIQYMEVDAPFSYFEWVEFNPSSHKQIIEVLNQAGWKPEDKTKTHIDTERELNKLKYTNKRSSELDLRLQSLYTKLNDLRVSGWKVNETNLDTLPKSAPAAARSIARRILLEARRRTLTEWLSLVRDGRIHGRFYGIGAWTHRMAHQNPNTANIPNEFDTAGNKKLYGKELRKLWVAPRNRLLTGVDAEGIQLRIFAHYIDDPEFTQALIDGKKEDKSDPHSLNQRILGEHCKSRAAAKRFIYAMLLGAGLSKLAEILGCSVPDAENALERLQDRYTGFARLKAEVIPADAKRGWFEGLDGRAVRIPGETIGSRKHLAMSGYLQNGEAVCMKLATLKWSSRLVEHNSRLVNFVHDEWQVECPNDTKICLEIAKMMADSLRQVGEELQLKCPLAGSYWNDDLKDYTIGTNWSVTH